jgi:hypothetical protein
MGSARLIRRVSGAGKDPKNLSPQCDGFKSSLEKVKIFDIGLKDPAGQDA